MSYCVSHRCHEVTALGRAGLRKLLSAVTPIAWALLSGALGTVSGVTNLVKYSFGYFEPQVYVTTGSSEVLLFFHWLLLVLFKHCGAFLYPDITDRVFNLEADTYPVALICIESNSPSPSVFAAREEEQPQQGGLCPSEAALQSHTGAVPHGVRSGAMKGWPWEQPVSRGNCLL